MSVETLRVWERRYGVINPHMTETGQRLYSANEITRLRLIKQQVDHGHPIGSIAQLSTAVLLEMNKNSGGLIGAESVEQVHTGQTIRVALVGPWTSMSKTSKTFSDNHLDIVARTAELSTAAQQLAGIEADIIAFELSVLQESSIENIQLAVVACAASKAIIFYRFAPPSALQQLRAASYDVIHKPLETIDLKWLYQVLRQAIATTGKTLTDEPTTTPPAPYFDEATLANIATSSSTLYCDCPRHLAELLISLRGFEIYSGQCANRDAKNATLHRDLQLTTGHARAALENAFLRLAQAEGITLPVQKQPHW